MFLVVAEGNEFMALEKLIPFLKEKKAVQGKATAYFCENRSCRLPTSDPGVFAGQLGNLVNAPDRQKGAE
jgi:uncharacterized protein YyaL (SSP411 family)